MKNVAVVGASGAVGNVMVRLLLERRFPISSIKFLASERSAGKTIEFDGRTYPIERLSASAFEGVDIVLSSTPASISREYSPIAARAGAVVVDNSSAWRMDPEVPLVVPEVNPGDIARHKGIIANPNCSTIQMVVALKPLHDAFRIRRVIVSTYQSVSGAGAKGLHELHEQTAAHVHGGEPPAPSKFSHPIAFPLPQGVKCEIPGDSKGTIVILTGSDKERMGQTAAKIRGFRPPEPYGGKGVRYQGEKVREKAGKAGKGGK